MSKVASFVVGSGPLSWCTSFFLKIATSRTYDTDDLEYTSSTNYLTIIQAIDHSSKSRVLSMPRPILWSNDLLGFPPAWHLLALHIVRPLVVLHNGRTPRASHVTQQIVTRHGEAACYPGLPRPFPLCFAISTTACDRDMHFPPQARSILAIARSLAHAGPQLA